MAKAKNRDHLIKVTRMELIKKVAKATGDTVRNVAVTVDVLLNTIMEEVISGKEVALQGFASFRPVKSAARDGRNPSTGLPMEIPAKTIGKCFLAKAFKDLK